MFGVGDKVICIHPEYEEYVGVIVERIDNPAYKTTYNILWKTKKGGYLKDGGFADCDLMPKYDPNDVLKWLCLK